MGPGRDHLLGTDDRGRDVLARMIHGSRVSLSVGFVAVSIYTVIGIFLGALAGFYGGRVDMIVSRIIEVMMCFPTFFLILALLAFLPRNIFMVMVVIGLTGWTGVARLVRGEFLKQRKLDYVTAGKAIGASNLRIIFYHVLPNSLAPVLVSATFGVAGAILTESSLSFLGFGVPPPTPSWGDILSQSKQYIDFAWWLTVFPGAAIFLTVTAYNLVGEGLRDAVDPRLK
jgi:peptide/nickel transport system permease protein